MSRLNPKDFERLRRTLRNKAMPFAARHLARHIERVVADHSMAQLTKCIAINDELTRWGTRGLYARCGPEGAVDFVHLTDGASITDAVNSTVMALRIETGGSRHAP